MTKRLIIAALVLSAATIARAYNEPAVNLGFTSFMDGAPPAGPGFYFQEYFQYFHADQFMNKKSGDMRLPEVNVFVSLNQVLYQSDQQILPGGGKWGVDFILPIVGFGSNGRTPLQENGAGIGDILIGPYIQWDPIMGKNGPIFMHRLELQCVTPTGRYHARRQLNPGSTFFSFDPYWAATLFLTPKWTLDWRLHYLWNDENDDVFGANTLQAGQAVHLNFSTAYEVIDKHLRVGINGYYLKQTTATAVNNHPIGDREEVLGLGPGAVWHFSPNDHIFGNVYFEMDGSNRPIGQRFILRYTHHF
jgi:anthranilate 1,2-dioxygenase (deaminating, decarboxylating) large subunit